MHVRTVAVGAMPDCVMSAAVQRAEQAPECPLRRRIYKAKDDAHARACSIRHLDASELFHITSGIAGRWAFRRSADPEELEQVLAILKGLYVAAGLLERLEVTL